MFKAISMLSVSPVRRIIDEALNQGKLSLIDELVSPDSPVIAEALHNWINAYRVAFPDLRCTVVDEVQQGDRIATRWTLRGTHNGPYLGNRPTGRSMEIGGMLYTRMVGRLIWEASFVLDRLDVLLQLGLVPPPRPPVEVGPAGGVEVLR